MLEFLHGMSLHSVNTQKCDTASFYQVFTVMSATTVTTPCDKLILADPAGVGALRSLTAVRRVVGLYVTGLLVLTVPFQQYR